MIYSGTQEKHHRLNRFRKKRKNKTIKKKKPQRSPVWLSERKHIFVYFALSRSVHTETGKNNLINRHFMEQLNRIELRGNVGNVRFSEAGTGKMARFSLATNYLYKNKDGDGSVETTWHNVVAWESRSIPDISIIEKGCPLYVCGRVRNSKYTAADGVEKQFFEVVASRICKVEETAVNR